MKRTREESNEQDNERELKRAKMTKETIENVPDELLIVILGRMSAKQGGNLLKKIFMHIFIYFCWVSYPPFNLVFLFCLNFSLLFFLISC
jgi:hypothetical protein